MNLHLSCEPLFLSPALLAEGDIPDTNLGERLPMALFFRVVLAPLLLEDNDLLAESLLDDLAGDLCAFERGTADVTFVAVRAEDDVVERDLGASVASQTWNSNCLSRLGPELLATGSDDCVSHGRCWC